MDHLLVFLSVILFVVYVVSSDDNIFIKTSRKSLRSGEVHPNQATFANSTSQRRRRHGYPPIAAPVPVPTAYVPPAPVSNVYFPSAPSYPDYPQVYSYSPYQAYQPPVQVFQQVAPPQQPFFQPPPPPQQPFIEPQPIIPQVIERYPLPSCYKDSSEFICCNCALEYEIERSYFELKNEHGGQWNNANIQSIANRIQKNSEARFSEDFEVIVGLGDFVTDSHFYKDLLCKIEREGRYMLAYATPYEPYNYYEEGIGGFPSAEPWIHSKPTGTCDAQAYANLNKKTFVGSGETDIYLSNKYVNVPELVRGNGLVTKFRI